LSEDQWGDVDAQPPNHQSEARREEPPPGPDEPITRARTRGRRPQLRIGAVIAVALVAALATWLVIRHTNGTSNQPSAASRASAEAISGRGLATLSAAASQPIYWLGPRRRFRYELTKAADGRIWIRYLPAGAPVGSDKPYLTVGTYPLANAYAVTRRAAQKSGSKRLQVRGAIAFYSDAAPTNIYLAYPGVGYQIEVYSPSASEAQTTVASGAVKPVDASATTGGAAAPKFVSAAALKALATQLKNPLYWVGPRPGINYELTELANGDVYVRYLPHGAGAGSTKPYLTIGTYPLPNSFKVTTTHADTSGNQKVSAGSDAIAFYAASRPTNIYVAYRSQNVQIEVFDSSPALARHLVTSRQLVIVR
jgi:hypothetical protein